MGLQLIDLGSITLAWIRLYQLGHLAKIRFLYNLVSDDDRQITNFDNSRQFFVLCVHEGGQAGVSDTKSSIAVLYIAFNARSLSVSEIYLYIYIYLYM